MDLEQLLRESKPETGHDLSRQNALVCSALAEQSRLDAKRRHHLLGRFCSALVESPIPTLTVSAAVFSFFLWQATVLLGAKGIWIGQAAAFLMNRGILP